MFVGNFNGEGHVNYVLMYEMLTGIHIAVSRIQAKVNLPLLTTTLPLAIHFPSICKCPTWLPLGHGPLTVDPSNSATN